MKNLIVLFIISIFFLNGCAYTQPRHTTASDWYNDTPPRSGTYTQNQAYTSEKMRGDVTRDGYRTDRDSHLTKEYGADAGVYITEKSIEQTLLQQIQDAIKSKNYQETQKLQQQLNSFRESQWNGMNGAQGGMVAGKKARLVSLDVINASERYIVQFTEEPLQSLVGQLGPGQTSQRKVRLPEGRYTIRYLEIPIGGNHYHQSERIANLYIKKTNTFIKIQ